MNSTFLNRFEIVNPRNRVDQVDLLNWIVRCHQEAAKNDKNQTSDDLDLIKNLFNRYGVKPSKIYQRYLESKDVLSLEFSKNKIYQFDALHKNGMDIAERAKFFSERSYEVFKKFYDIEKVVKRPDHLIHVTCTGYVSPSAAQRIVTEKNWKQSTDITHAYHMGCYAAMPSVRLAKCLVTAAVDEPNYTVDIVHNEMCGLHMNPLTQTPEQVVVQTLFADGHIKYTASANGMANGKNLKVIAILERIIPESEEDMGWIPACWGMKMNLSRDVPEKIKLSLSEFSNDLFKKARLNVQQAMKSIFAIHPGGPKIIEVVQRHLQITDDQVRESKKVLYERGNMSSATLPHVWSEILNGSYPVGTKVISFAFGPGLTLFGSVFEVC